MNNESLLPLLNAIQNVQSQYIEDAEPGKVFDALLESLLLLTNSEYGFIGEVLQTGAGEHYLRTQAITNIAWDEGTRRFYDESAPTGLEFYNLETLFGAVMTSGRPVVANDPAHDPRRGGLPPGHPDLRAFLGLPLFSGDRMVGMIGIANRPDGYDESLVKYLGPLTATCAGIIRAYRNAREREHADEQRRTSEGQMRHMQKLESLGLLVGGIAHDFNNLLTGMLGNAELALLELNPSDSLHGLISEVHLTATRAVELTHQLLVYTGKSASSVDTFDLSEVVAEMSTLARSVVPHSASLQIQSQTSPIWIRANATQVRQLVMNLITNASDSLGDQGGHISVSTGLGTVDPDALNECFVLGRAEPIEYASIEVIDDGCGMSRETIERIFDPFFSSKGAGRGLGLAIAFGIVRNHDALLTVESVVGGGTTFRVFFPQVQARPPSQSDLRESPRNRPESTESTLLVVDDEPAVARVTAGMAKRIGFRVLSAGGGSEAIEILRDTSREVAAVVLDATMPEMDGEATFHSLREIRPDLPVLFVSGYGTHELAQLIESKTAVSFLEKPFSLKALEEQLRILLSD